MHQSVMLKEAIDLLSVTQDNNIYVDCNFGSGGYTKEILKRSPNAKVIGVDQDGSCLQFADQIKKDFGSERFVFIHGNFIEIDLLLKQIGIEKVDGFVFDLGLSDMQLADNTRGFAFTSNKLDMRMDQNSKSKNASDIINKMAEQDLADLIYQYGDERHSRKIARYIVNYRIKQPILEASVLADIIYRAIGSKKYNKIHPATKTFQALRIFVNKELDNLKECFYKLPKILNQSGRIVVVSFHSGEDGIIKSIFREWHGPKIGQSKYSKIVSHPRVMQIVTKKPILPSEVEVYSNHSARSAKLRAVTRTALEINEL